MKTLLPLLIMILLIGCGSSSDVAIGGTDTELVGKPVVTGAIYSLAGDPVPDIEVKLIPTDFRPGIDNDTAIHSSMTDDSGIYSIPVLLNISYNMIVRDTVQHESVFKKIKVPAQTDTGTVTVQADTLSQSGAVEVALNDSLQGKETIISMTGTDIFLTTSETSVLMSELPTGDLPELAVYNEIDSATITVIEEVVVDTADTTKLPYDYSVLFLYDAKTSYLYQVESQNFIIDMLKNLFSSVTVVRTETLDNVIISSYDVVYLIGTVDSLLDSTGYDHAPTLASTTVPIVCGSYQLFYELNFTNNETTQYSAEDQMNIERDHEITPSDETSFSIFKNDSSRNISAATPAGSGKSILSGENNPSQSTLFVYDKAAGMGNGKSAPGRRAALFEIDDFRELSDESLSIIRRTLLWATGEL